MYDAYSILVYNLAVLLARRGDEARKFTTKSIAYERNRRLGGFSRPRVSFNILNNKEDPEGELRTMSMNGTRECAMECYTCDKDHDNKNIRCPLTTFDMVYERRTELYVRSLASSRKQAVDFDKDWQDVKFLLRIRYDDNGVMVRFYSGGKSHRGLSEKNMTKL